MKATRSLALSWLVMVACVTATTLGCSTRPNEGSTIDVINWWSEDGEYQAMKSLIALFEKTYPNQDVFNGRVKDAPTARAEIRKQVIAGFPPETFQANGGWDLLSWVAYNKKDAEGTRLEPLDEYATWQSAIPAPVLDAVRFEEKIYAVPLNIHRLNVLFFNKRVFLDNDIPLPTSESLKTLDDLFALCDALRGNEAFASKQIRPIALAAKDPSWLSLYLFENILVARAGGADYRDYFRGNVDSLTWPPLRTAIEDLSKLLSYDPAAHEREWNGAVDEMRQGRAAMTIMGDWAKGYIDYKQEPVEYDAIPTPGTDSTFVFTTDTFGLTLGAGNRDGALKLLDLFGSSEGQNEFNVVKGSIPARTDADLLRFTGTSRQTIADFYDAVAGNRVTLVPATSILAPPDYMDAIFKLLTDYASDNPALSGNTSVLLTGLKNRADVLRNYAMIWSYGD
jgi:glucose/mannose transport system substrate-binding protein